jgi:hypothetical protein
MAFLGAAGDGEGGKPDRSRAETTLAPECRRSIPVRSPCLQRGRRRGFRARHRDRRPAGIADRSHRNNPRRLPTSSAWQDASRAVVRPFGARAPLVSTRPGAARRRSTPAGCPATRDPPPGPAEWPGCLLFSPHRWSSPRPRGPTKRSSPPKAGPRTASGGTATTSSSTASRWCLSSGEIHYARVPAELWRDRLVKATRAGPQHDLDLILLERARARGGGLRLLRQPRPRRLAVADRGAGDVRDRPAGSVQLRRCGSRGDPAVDHRQPGMHIRTDYAAYVRPPTPTMTRILPINAEPPAPPRRERPARAARERAPRRLGHGQQPPS